jgi:hypothetical protein
MLVSRKDLATVLSVLDGILKHPDLVDHAMSQGGDGWNVEQYLLFHLFNQGVLHKVRRFPPCMYTVRSNDTVTSWSHGTWYKELGYFVKYQGEYDRTQKTMHAYMEKGPLGEGGPTKVQANGFSAGPKTRKFPAISFS